jgi:hypothetical protein
LLIKLHKAGEDMERAKQEKDDEVAILQEGMDSTLKELAEAQQARSSR